MSFISNEIVQVYIPVTDVRKSAEWYKSVLGFTVIWESDQAANLKSENGPLLFLKRCKHVTPLTFETLEGEISPVLSVKTSDLRSCHQELIAKNIKVSEITEHGNGKLGVYEDFIIEDPDNHLIEISSFPDIALPEFRGY